MARDAKAVTHLGVDKDDDGDALLSILAQMQ
jgi:hypothetical protein